MAIRICPECGGKCSTTRNICIHCGYEFKATKKCPECESEVPEDANECPECGYIFNTNNASAAPTVQATTASETHQTSASEPKEEKKASGVVCTQCGSGDTTKIDEYTYKCNMCGTIISLPRPDTNITNINSFVANTDDVPVYQLKQNITEKDFVRMVVLDMAGNGDVSADFLKGFTGHEEDVKKAYITFAEVPYSVDVSYTCQIGTDYEVTYGDGSKKKQTKWESFSGNANDGGTSFLCSYGKETNIDFLRPIYFKSSQDEFVPFTESDTFPLKRRIDRSVQEQEKVGIIERLAAECRYNLPGDHVDQWRYNGRVNFQPIDTFYYVPTFNLTGESNGHKVLFSAPATDHGKIFTYMEDGGGIVNDSSKTQPTKKSAKAEFKRHKLLYALLLTALILGFVVAGVSLILTFVLSDFYLLIAAAFGLATGIAANVLSNKTIGSILNNQTYDFKNAKAEACVSCLSNNGLAPLTGEEKAKIDASSMSKKDLKEKAKRTTSIVMMAVTLASLLIGSLVPVLSSLDFGGGNNRNSSSGQGYGGAYGLVGVDVYTGGGKVSVSGPGVNEMVTDIYEGEFELGIGNTVHLSAIPYDGYCFEGWYLGSNRGGYYSTSASITIILDENNFVGGYYLASFGMLPPAKHTLTIVNSDYSAGAVSDGSYSFTYGSGVSFWLIAEPNDGYEFAGWYEGDSLLSSDSSGFEFCPPDRDVTLTAKWNKLSYLLSVRSSKYGQVYVYPSNDDCYYEYGTEITVVAVADEGYYFSCWYSSSRSSEGEEIYESSYTFTMPNSDLSLYASFSQILYTLTVTSNDETMGTVSYRNSFAAGEEATVCAYPNEGYGFVGWYDSDNVLASSERYYTFFMPNHDYSLTAVFKEPNYGTSDNPLTIAEAKFTLDTDAAKEIHDKYNEGNCSASPMYVKGIIESASRNIWANNRYSFWLQSDDGSIANDFHINYSIDDSSIIGDSISIDDLRGKEIVCFGYGIVDDTGYNLGSFTNSDGTVDSTIISINNAALVDPVSAELSSTSVSIDVNEKYSLTAKVYPANNNAAGVVWSSGNESIATVVDGVITGVAAGTTEITVTAGAVSAACTVTVSGTVVGTTYSLTANSLDLDNDTFTGIKEIDGVTFDYKSVYTDSASMILQGGSNSAVANSTDFSKGIAKVVVNLNYIELDNDCSDFFEISFSSDGSIWTTAVAVNKIAGSVTYAVRPDATSYTYFKLIHTGGTNGCWGHYDSISIILSA